MQCSPGFEIGLGLGLGLGRRVLASILLALALTPRAAQAGNDDELFVGNQAAMVGGAVSAVVRDSSSIWYNPAGLGAIDRDQVDVSATAYTLRLYSAPDFISTIEGDSDDASVTEFVVAPSQIAYVRRLDSGLCLGLGYFMPRSENYVLREALDAGTPLRGSAWQIAGAVTEAQHVGAAAVGYGLTPRIRLGASLIGGFRAATQSVALFGSATERAQQVAAKSLTFIGTESRLTLQVGLGIQAELSDAFVLGISVRGPEVQLHEDSDTSANTVISSLEDPAQPLLVSVQSRFREGHGVDVFRAGRAGIALAYRFTRGWASAEIDVQPALRRGEVDRVTLVNGRAGIYFAFAEHVALGAGFFTDRLGERERWVLVSGGGDFYGGTLGVELSNEHLLAPNERVKSLVFSSVFAIRYAFSAGDIGRTEVDPKLIRDLESDNGPFVAKRGDMNVHEIGVYVGSGLRF